MSDDLRERIERRMREAVDAAHNAPGVLPLTPTAHPAFDAAVSVCEAIVREERARRGHASRCMCHPTDCHVREIVKEEAIGPSSVRQWLAPDAGHTHPYHDPRCAPQGKES